jgi:hypothetical protein
MWRITKFDNGILGFCDSYLNGLNRRNAQTNLRASETTNSSASKPTNPVDPNPEGPQVPCDVCGESATRYIKCEADHVICIACMTESVQSQCTHIPEFVVNRGFKCPMDITDKSSKWRFSRDEIEHR